MNRTSNKDILRAKYSFIPRIHLAYLQEAYSEVFPAMAKQRRLEQLAEMHIVVGQQAQLKWEPVPDGGPYNQEQWVLPER